MTDILKQFYPFIYRTKEYWTRRRTIFDDRQVGLDAKFHLHGFVMRVLFWLHTRVDGNSMCNENKQRIVPIRMVCRKCGTDLVKRLRRHASNGQVPLLGFEVAR